MESEESLSELAPAVTELGEMRGRGRGRQPRSRFSAGGTFNLGSSNRAGNDEESELELDLGEGGEINNPLGCNGGRCEMSEEQLKLMFQHAWKRGYDHQNAEPRRGSSPTRNAPFASKGWGCAADSVYFHEWMVRDQYAGCFLQPGSHPKEVQDLIRDKVVPTEKSNKNYYLRACEVTRSLASYALYNQGCDPQTSSPNVSPKAGKFHERLSEYPAEEIPSKCGSFVTDSFMGPPWYWHLNAINGTGDPFFLQLAATKLGGKCVARDRYLSDSVPASASIPGQCMDTKGQCQCFDGHQRPTGDLQVTATVYRVLTIVLEWFGLFIDLNCYDAPAFDCTVRPIKPGKGATAAEIAAFKVKHAAITDKCSQKYPGLESSGIRSSELGEASGNKQKWGKIKKFAKKARSTFKKAASRTKSFARKAGSFAKKARSKVLKKTLSGLRAAAKKIAHKILNKSFWRLADKLIDKDKIVVSAELVYIWRHVDFRKFVRKTVKKALGKLKYKSIDTVLGLWQKKKLQPHVAWKLWFSDGFRADWRRPFDGIFSKLVALLKFDPRVLTQMCSAGAVFQTQSTGQGTGYERRSMSKIVINAPEKLKRYVAKKSEDPMAIQLYVIKALPKFWRRAASIKVSSIKIDGTKTESDEPEFQCASMKYRKSTTNLFVPEKTPWGREVDWGCPDAVPVFSADGQPEWWSSGRGEPMVIKDEKLPQKGDLICRPGDGSDSCANMGLQCAHQLNLKLTVCDTCCCKEGLTTSEVTSELIYGEKEECAGVFAIMDGLVRGIMSISRVATISDLNGPMCMSSDSIKRSNLEVCEKFKCEDGRTSGGGRSMPPSVAERLCKDHKCKNEIAVVTEIGDN